MKCPKQFDIFLPMQEYRNGEDGAYIHVPEWLFRAIRRRDKRGFMRVKFGRWLYGGYTGVQRARIEKEIRKYLESSAYKRLRLRMKKGD
jgi:hypothetical protein